MDLPPELLIHIFDFFSTKELYHTLTVNRKWFYYAISKLWRKVDIYGKQITKLLDIWSSVSHKYGSLLHYLTITFSSITNTGILEIIRLTSNLQCLKLAYCRNITDVAICRILSLRPNLSLKICYCGSITNTTVYELTHLCNHLQVLHLNGCKDIPVKAIWTLIYRSSKLHTIKLDDCTCCLTDEIIQIIADSCPNLQYLSLTHQNRITDMSIGNLVKACLKLQQISLRDCKNITDLSILDIAHVCSVRLRKLKLCFIKIHDSSIREIVHHCPNLQYIYLHGCNEITDESIYTIASSCPDLYRLNVTFCERIANTDVITEVIHSNLRNLSSLNIGRILG